MTTVAALLVSTCITVMVVLHGVTYRVQGYRLKTALLDRSHLSKLRQQFQDEYGSSTSSHSLQEFALSRTASTLHFKMQQSAVVNPNTILDNKAAHCKMYAIVTACIYNQLAEEKRWKSRCRVAYGQVQLWGISLNSFIPSSFFKNHDFCVLGESDQPKVAIDATMFDYFLISNIPIRQ